MKKGHYRSLTHEYRCVSLSKSINKQKQCIKKDKTSYCANATKEKTCTLISSLAEKASDNILHSFTVNEIDFLMLNLFAFLG